MIQLMQGDCLERMKEIPDGSVDLVLCDLPYGIDYQSQRKKDRSRWFPKIANDQRPLTACIPLLARLMNNHGGLFLFTRRDVQQPVIDALHGNGFSVKSMLIWDKGSHGMGDLKRAYGSRYESIIWAAMPGFRFPGKRPTDIIRVPKVPASSLVHPNEKPVALLETLIRQTTHEGDRVLDFCMGSGSTGVACVNTGRSFIGIELDGHWFDVAEKRIREAHG